MHASIWILINSIAYFINRINTRFSGPIFAPLVNDRIHVGNNGTSNQRKTRNSSPPMKITGQRKKSMVSVP